MGQLGLRLSRPARAHGVARGGRPARLSRPGHGPFSPPLSLTERAQGQRPTLPPTGGALLSVSHRIWCGGQIRCGLGPCGSVCAWVSLCVCACVWRARRVCSIKCPKELGHDACDAMVSMRGHRARQGRGRVEARRRQDDGGAGKARGAHGSIRRRSCPRAGSRRSGPATRHGGVRQGDGRHQG
jgi:hypothetical protein